MDETQVEQYLIKEVKKLGGYCLKWTCPGWSGVPDRIILLPRGRVYFAELKRPKGGVVSALQLQWIARLGRLGFDARVLNTTELIDDFIKEIVYGC